MSEKTASEKAAKAACSHIESCELFPLIDKPGFLRVWKIKYCEAEFAACARHQLSLQGKTVPVTLLPNGQDLAGLAKKVQKT